ncbi:glycoprotein-N-acetylgalactosamine 3-beta-galactosyltransferase 1-like [Penaeus monodon]|uniref:glycoprotein-N-acetylgalactosamine 3-beta-galactosyltransferase 1-like n=1 Tax=Penaeus monodon TaxID=6687 RepID=UPI0018A72132|nr:glycoprotein-N-acetylgalactosamine 3-beta-galactosyltransferase 1-like [Penaeus monodon]
MFVFSYFTSEENITRIHEEVNKSRMFKKAIVLVKELQEAKRLSEEVTILCWIPLSPEAHDQTARHVRATWGKRCNKLVFMSTKDDPSIGAVNVGSKEGYAYLWQKTMFSLQYIYKHFFDDFQWRVKTDDNIYVIMENLRYMLRAYDTNDPIYFGLYYKNFGRYNAGGAGYVMGRESVRRFIEQALPNTAICQGQCEGRDIPLGNCLQRVGVKFGDTRDHIGQGRFWQHHPISIIKETKLVESYQHYPVLEWPNSSSDTVISFHRMTTSDLYLMEYFIYNIRIFGHMPTLPLAVFLPPDLNVVPNKVLASYILLSRDFMTLAVRPNLQETYSHWGFASLLNVSRTTKGFPRRNSNISTVKAVTLILPKLPTPPL